MKHMGLKVEEVDTSEALELLKSGWTAEIFVDKKEGGIYFPRTGEVRTISLESFCRLMPKAKIFAIEGIIRLKAKGSHV